MKYRHGTCQSCQAQYKVPASFQADRAKCKSCGGVVQIGPVDGPAPARERPAPKGQQPTPVPAKPVAARPAQPAAKPAQAPAAAKPAGTTDSVRAAAEATAERVRNAGRKSGAGARAGAGKAAAAKGSRSTSASRSSRRSSAPKSKAPVLVAVVALIAVGGGSAWFLTRDSAEGSQAAEKSAAAPEAAASDTAAADESAARLAAQQAADEAAAAAAAEEAEVAAAEQAAAEEQAAKAPASDVIDLSLLADQEKLPGTSDADWAEIQGWVATFLDPSAGAAGNRARAKLFERGREAFPAVLNAMKRLDYTQESGYRDGDLSQKLLMDICSGSNFGWSYGIEPKDVSYNTKAVRFWFVSWEQAREAPKAWAKLAKITEEEAQKQFAATGPFQEASADPAPAADLLDDF